MRPVEIYTTPTCGYCAMAKRLLQRKGVPYHEIDVSADPSLRAAMVQRANGRRTVQQLVSAPAERQALRNEITEGRERFIAAFKLLSEQVKRVGD